MQGNVSGRLLFVSSDLQTNAIPVFITLWEGGLKATCGDKEKPMPTREHSPARPATTPTIRLLVRERGNNRWHQFKSIHRAAQYALLLDARMSTRVAFPVAILENEQLVWGSYEVLEPSKPTATLIELASPVTC